MKTYARFIIVVVVLVVTLSLTVAAASTFQAASGHHEWVARGTTPSLTPHQSPGAAITDSQNVAFIGQIGGPSYTVAAQGVYVYIAMGPVLAIFDVSNPAAPSIVGQSVSLPDYAYDVAVASNLAVVTGGWDSDLWVIDITNPSTPYQIGFYEMPDFAYGVAVTGSYAYVGDQHALRVIDLTDPVSPTLVSSFGLPGPNYGIAVAGNFAYVASSGSGLHVIDISNPITLTEIGSYDTPGTAADVAVSGNYAYVADLDDGLRVIDVSVPSMPTEVGFVTTPDFARGVAIAGNYAYVSASSDGLRVIDVANPSAPVEVGFYDTPGAAYSAVISNNHAFVADGPYTYFGLSTGCWGGLRVIDVSMPSTPTEVSSYYGPGCPQGVTIDGRYAYVADGHTGLHVIDVSVPEFPLAIGSVDTPGYAKGVAIAGNYAYVADGASGLRVIDVADPGAPSEIGSLDIPAGYAHGLTIAGNYVYLADGNWGRLRVIDISVPGNPTEVGSGYTSGTPYDVVVDGNYAYVAAGSNGVRIFDVSTPDSPVSAGTYDTLGTARGIASSGNYIYVADDDAGLRVIDVSVPMTPTEVGFYDSPGSAYDVSVAGIYAYLADEDGGLRVIDVSTPGTPIEVGYHAMVDKAVGVAVSGPTVYLADESAGLLIFRHTGPIIKNGPQAAANGELITYTIQVDNQLPITLTGIVITDAIPVGATYIGGGSQVGDVVSWTVPSLVAGEVITRQFAVTATTTITNNDYRITASGGFSATGSVPVVTIVQMPVAGLAATNDSPTIIGDVTSLTATTTTGSDVTYRWAFGDGQTGSGAATSHLYPAVGVYTAVVTARNLVSSLTTTTPITIVDAAIAGLAAMNDSPTILGQATIMSATIAAGTNVTYVWNFGDGQIDTGRVVGHTYADVGSYTAIVTASNSVSTMVATSVITITDVPIGTLIAANDSPTRLGSMTTLTASITTGSHVNFTWNFGDGSFSTGPIVGYTYPAVGMYTAMVTASNSVSTITATTRVTIAEAITGLTAVNDSPTILADATTFTATITAGSDVSYTWDFGDDLNAIGQVVTHAYAVPGTYTVTVTAVNSVSMVSATTTVTILEQQYLLYLPVVMKP